MGRLQKEEETVHHFSHDLQLMPFTQSRYANLHTRCCGPPPSSISATLNDPIYTCTLCNFSIHKSCSRLPGSSPILATLPTVSPSSLSPSISTAPSPATPAPTPHLPHSPTTASNATTTSTPTAPPCRSPPPIPPTPILSPSPSFALPQRRPSPVGCGICLAKGGSAWHYRCSLCGFATHLHCDRAAQPTLPAVSPSPSTGIPVRPPTAPVRPPSQVSWATGLTVHGRPMGQLSRLPTVGSLLSDPAALTSIVCSLAGVPPMFTGSLVWVGSGDRTALLLPFRPLVWEEADGVVPVWEILEEGMIVIWIVKVRQMVSTTRKRWDALKVEPLILVALTLEPLILVGVNGRD